MYNLSTQSTHAGSGSLRCIMRVRRKAAGGSWGAMRQEMRQMRQENSGGILKNGALKSSLGSKISDLSTSEEEPGVFAV